MLANIQRHHTLEPWQPYTLETIYMPYTLTTLDTRSNVSDTDSRNCCPSLKTHHNFGSNMTKHLQFSPTAICLSISYQLCTCNPFLAILHHVFWCVVLLKHNQIQSNCVTLCLHLGFDNLCVFQPSCLNGICLVFLLLLLILFLRIWLLNGRPLLISGFLFCDSGSRSGKQQSHSP